MYPDGLGSLAFILLLLNIVWMAGLSLLVWKDHTFLKKLFPEGEGDFKVRLGQAFKEIEKLEDFKSQSLKYVQKIALKRYNPYRDTGGDQSFSVSLLDGTGNGLVVTSLHSRAGTRVFAKPVKGGEDGEFQLSAEEKEVVKEALQK